MFVHINRFRITLAVMTLWAAACSSSEAIHPLATDGSAVATGDGGMDSAMHSETGAMPDGGHSMGGDAALEPEALAAMNTLLTRFSSSVSYHSEMSHWGLAGAGGEKFEWTSDTAANVADIAMVLPAQELVDAGVDRAKLEAAGWLYSAAASGEHGTTPALFIRPFDLDAAASGPGAETDTAGKAFARILARFASRLGYHSEMAHYGLTLTGANKVEWTKDADMGDADLAFVLEAAPLVTAGADVAKLKTAGWLYNEASGATPALLIRPIKLK